MSPERFLAGVLMLGLALVPLVLGARAVRAKLMPEARGALAWVAEAVIVIGATLTAAHLLGAIGLLYAVPLTAVCAAAGLTAWRLLPAPPGARLDLRTVRDAVTPASALASIPIVLVVGAWVARSAATLDRGTPNNVDTYWYHMPVAARFAAEHSIGGLFRSTDPVLGFYAADGSLLHGTGILLVGGDVLSPLLNLVFLALALASAAAIGRLSGAGMLAPGAVAVVLLAPVMRGSQPGEAKDDVIVLALALAAAAIIASGRLRPGGMAVAGIAIGLIAGAKVTGLAAAGALAVGAVVMAEGGTRTRGAVVGALAAGVTGATWYVRNLIETGSPLPFVSVPGWEPPRSPALEGPWSTSIAHYATDVAVWTDHFAPGLELMFGGLWFVVVAAAVVGAAVGALHGGAARVLSAAAAVAFVAYATAPTMAGGPEGAPALFPYQIRHGLTGPLLGLLAGSWSLGRASARVRFAAGGLIAVLGLAVLRAPAGVPALPAWTVAAGAVAVICGAAIALLSQPRRRMAAAAVAVAVLALIGTRYRDGAYLRGDLARTPITQTGAQSQRLVPVFAWGRDVRDSRIGIVGTFHQYPFYGLTLSNRVEQVGRPLEHGGFDETARSCTELAASLRARSYDYVVTVPRRIEYGDRLAPPAEQRWLDTAGGARRVLGSGRDGIAVHAVDGPLRCGAG